MLSPYRQSGLGLLALIVLALLTGCRSAPVVDFAPDPIHVIEVDGAQAAEGAEEAAVVITTHSSVVWLNSSAETLMKIKVLGFFDENDAVEHCFETRSECATLRDVLSPGDAASLRFPTPGIYYYSVNGPDQPVRGRIVVRDYAG